MCQPVDVQYKPIDVCSESIVITESPSIVSPDDAEIYMGFMVENPVSSFIIKTLPAVVEATDGRVIPNELPEEFAPII